MSSQAQFTPIDLQTWPRREQFYYFAQMAPTGYSLTVQLDVTRMKTALDRAERKFFPAYLWLVTKVLNRQPEFRVAEQDGVLGVYSHLTPLYASFHPDDKTFSLLWTEFSDDFREFYKNYIQNQTCCGEKHGILGRTDELPPPNAYTVSCLPWVHFDHFAVHSYENKAYYFPSVEAGKWKEEDGVLRMPLSITCHHATTDGYHVSLFLEQLQQEADQFDQYLF